MRISCIPHGLVTLQCIFPRNKGILFHDHIMDSNLSQSDTSRILLKICFILVLSIDLRVF